MSSPVCIVDKVPVACASCHLSASNHIHSFKYMILCWSVQLLWPATLKSDAHKLFFRFFLHCSSVIKLFTRISVRFCYCCCQIYLSSYAVISELTAESTSCLHSIYCIYCVSCMYCIYCILCHVLIWTQRRFVDLVLGALTVPLPILTVDYRMGLKVKVKVKGTLVEALRLCTGCTVHRGSRGIAVLYRH